MTLSEAKELLKENNIPFSETCFSSISEFCLHIDPYVKCICNNTPVISLTVKSNNGQKNIELEFIDENNDGNYSLYDLWFGGFSYEFFVYEEECLRQSVLYEINRIISNNMIFIVANDLKKKKWLGDACFDLREAEDDFGKSMQRIKKPKSFISKLTKSQELYEIYDWNTYQRIIK